MPEKIAIHAVISGLVQGVCYRATALEEGRALALIGWVRNTSDGRVEVMACGSEVAIATFGEWLKHGPKRARVERADIRQVSVEAFKALKTFEIKLTE